MYLEGNTNTGNTATEITTGGGDDGGSDGGGDVDTGHTVDEDGNKVCNTEGYVYNPETKICEPKKEEEEVDGTPGSGIGTGTSGESFDDVLKRVDGCAKMLHLYLRMLIYARGWHGRIKSRCG